MPPPRKICSFYVKLLRVRKTGRQTDRQTDKQTNKQTNAGHYITFLEEVMNANKCASTPHRRNVFLRRHSASGLAMTLTFDL